MSAAAARHTPSVRPALRLLPRLLLAAIALAGVVASPAIPAARAATALPGDGSLGDLSAYRRVVTDTQALVAQDDLPAARRRIKDLEIAWDGAEPTLKPRDPQAWRRLDKAIDRALAALRAAAPQQGACRQALADLAASMDMPG